MERVCAQQVGGLLLYMPCLLCSWPDAFVVTSRLRACLPECGHVRVKACVHAGVCCRLAPF